MANPRSAEKQRKYELLLVLLSDHPEGLLTRELSEKSQLSMKTTHHLLTDLHKAKKIAKKYTHTYHQWGLRTTKKLVVRWYLETKA